MRFDIVVNNSFLGGGFVLLTIACLLAFLAWKVK